MALFDNLLAFTIILGLAVIGYCKFTNKTLVDFIKEIKEIFSDGTEELSEGGGFQT